jgi:hypothetical protein
MAETSVDAQTLLTLPPERVYQQFGDMLARQTLGAAPKTPSECVALAKNWLERNQKALAKIVCHDDIIKLCRRFPERKLTLAYALTEILVGTYGALFATHLAILIMLEGIDQLCASGPSD